MAGPGRHCGTGGDAGISYRIYKTAFDSAQGCFPSLGANFTDSVASDDRTPSLSICRALVGADFIGPIDGSRTYIDIKAASPISLAALAAWHCCAISLLHLAIYDYGL